MGGAFQSEARQARMRDRPCGVWTIRCRSSTCRCMQSMRRSMTCSDQRDGTRCSSRAPRYARWGWQSSVPFATPRKAHRSAYRLASCPCGGIRRRGRVFLPTGAELRSAMSLSHLLIEQGRYSVWLQSARHEPEHPSQCASTVRRDQAHEVSSESSVESATLWR
jgi:hypothetical protein